MEQCKLREEVEGKMLDEVNEALYAHLPKSDYFSVSTPARIILGVVDERVFRVDLRNEPDGR